VAAIAKEVSSFSAGGVRFALWTMPKGKILFQKRSTENGGILENKIYPAGREDAAAAEFEYLRATLLGESLDAIEFVEGAELQKVAAQYEIFGNS
jgi:hypothetical protein